MNKFIEVMHEAAQLEHEAEISTNAQLLRATSAPFPYDELEQEMNEESNEENKSLPGAPSTGGNSPRRVSCTSQGGNGLKIVRWAMFAMGLLALYLFFPAPAESCWMQQRERLEKEASNFTYDIVEELSLIHI